MKKEKWNLVIAFILIIILVLLIYLWGGDSILG